MLNELLGNSSLLIIGGIGLEEMLLGFIGFLTVVVLVVRRVEKSFKSRGEEKND